MTARWARGLSTVLVLVASSMWPAGYAVAVAEESASPAVLQTNWYWHHVTVDAPVVVPPEVPSEPSNVPDGDLPVASLDGQGARSKVSVVAFNVPATGLGTTVSSFTVTMTVDPAANNIQTEPPKLAAGLCLRNWSNGPGGEQDTVNAPPVDETGLVEGTWSADAKTIEFKIPAVAQAWFDDVNFGMELVPAAGYTTPFQLSFTSKDVKATMSYSPPAPAVVVDQPEDQGNDGTVTPPVLDGGTPIDTGGLPATGGFVPSPQVPTDVGSAPVPQVSQPQPAASVGALPEVSSRPSAGLFWSGVGLALVLVVLSVVLGGEPVSPASARQSRLTSVLRQRAAARSLTA